MFNWPLQSSQRVNGAFVFHIQIDDDDDGKTQFTLKVVCNYLFELSFMKYELFEVLITSLLFVEMGFRDGVQSVKCCT